MNTAAGLVQLGTDVWVRPGNIISVAPHGGSDGSSEPGHYFINVKMPGYGDSSYVCNQLSDWPMAKVIEALQDFWKIPEMEEMK